MGTVMNKSQVIKALENGKMSTAMLPVLNRLGFTFEFFLRYARVNKTTKQTVINYLIDAINKDI